MPTSSSYSSPTRLSHSIQDSGDLQRQAHLSVLDEKDSIQQAWTSSANANIKPSTRLQKSPFLYKQASHKRNSSNSTIGSIEPLSPHTPTSSYPRIVDSDSSSYPSPGLEHIDSAQNSGNSYSKPLSTLSHVSCQGSFLTPAFQDYSALTYDAEACMATHTAMTELLMTHQASEMDVGDNSGSRSSYGGDEYDESYKSSLDSQTIIPKFDRTISEICQDELYNPNNSVSASTSQSRPSQHSMPSPYRNVFTERLQAANNEHMSARTASPVPRDKSPFREGREGIFDYRAGDYLKPDQRIPRLGTAAQLREQQKDRTVAMALGQHHNKANHLIPSKTISPKETHLDYQDSEDDSRRPLFSQDKSHSHGKEPRPSKLNLSEELSSQSESNVNMTEQLQDSTSMPKGQSSSNYSMKSNSAQSRPNFPFVQPAVAGHATVPQQYPFISHSRSQSISSRIISDQIPEFPAHLTSMDTTKSDNGQSESSTDNGRPANTMADSGTYTCTYHGCTQRFATPTKLQKHKRDTHRPSTPQTTPLGSIANTPSGNTFDTANRNSQAGPHRCDRINPSTNKPCNSVFSRPYDLTRHEDTIHNSRKQKVRCQSCIEEKTFSRNDALTRHMRVVHPEVDFPGKSKRKGAS